MRDTIKIKDSNILTIAGVLFFGFFFSCLIGHNAHYCAGWNDCSHTILAALATLKR